MVLLIDTYILTGSFCALQLILASHDICKVTWWQPLCAVRLCTWWAPSGVLRTPHCCLTRWHIVCVGPLIMSMFSLPGSRSNNVPELWCQSRPVEHRDCYLSVSGGEATLSGQSNERCVSVSCISWNRGLLSFLVALLKTTFSFQVIVVLMFCCHSAKRLAAASLLHYCCGNTVVLCHLCTVLVSAFCSVSHRQTVHRTWGCSMRKTRRWCQSKKQHYSQGCYWTRCNS